MTPPRVDYQRLAIFAAVAKHASFTKAAQKLGLSKGSVSRAITELERQLGTQLVHRTTHAVSLSTAGTAFYEQTASHLDALSDAVLQLPERAAAPSGDLRLTAPHDFGVSVLPPIITQFGIHYPEIRVDLRLSNEFVDLVAEGFDMGIRLSPEPLQDSSLTARRLGPGTTWAFFGAPSYLSRRGSPKQVGDARYDWIVHSVMARTLELPRETRVRYIANDFVFMRELAREGAGIAMMPVWLAQPFVRDGHLEEVLASDRPSPHGAAYVLYPSSGQVPRKITAFRDFLVERCPAL